MIKEKHSHIVNKAAERHVHPIQPTVCILSLFAVCMLTVSISLYIVLVEVTVQPLFCMLLAYITPWVVPHT